MFIIVSYSIRVFLVYFFTYLATRIMTKKAMAEMTAYEIAGLMILANVASEPLVDKVVIKSVYGIGFLVILIAVAARLAIVNKFTAFFEHTATKVIENGQINMEVLKRLNFSLNQLEGLLRQQGYDKVSDVETAFFEPQGNLSVFPKAENKPVTLKDLNIQAANNPITLPLIIDGSIDYVNLKHIEKSESWLLGELKKQGVKEYKNEVALAELDSCWNVVILRK
ncbi:DUF421 domain-containing protein [Clostridiaceae bacterium UIB06]|uniref:DUF421 domain-containing protein n=1 Tax=Clostridium thailandense TaxID=2794346 RepID=A0A949TXC8_9CLOT|nr:DUF421 domain-containing protein [Clostridium thailandense]MBV7274268.1 DUF421 domain-containing protein [Clostridium thailandense]MCH5136168.1 DUF421 domain-containing protein [Clostridiaceae bacterium UIB06]